jgi:energy-converting hydrogenase Eha subunit E
VREFRLDYIVALVQGLYFLISGIWPVLSIKTFQIVTGPKTDLWLVKTVGLILAVIGAVLIFAQVNGEINTSIIFLAIGSALSLVIVELIYVAKRVISPIYLLDAFVEVLLIAWWSISMILR